MKKIIIVIILVFLVSGCSSDTSDVQTNHKEEVKVSDETYQLLFSNLIESIRLNASKQGLILNSINQDKHSLNIYVDNYNNQEISDKNGFEQLYNLVSHYYDINTDFELKTIFYVLHGSYDNTSTISKEVSFMQRFDGNYGIWINDNNPLYITKERTTVYKKQDNLTRIISKLMSENRDLILAGVSIQDYNLIHQINSNNSQNIENNYVPRHSYQGSSDNPGDYSNAYDYFYENQDHLSEDQAYERYYDEYGDE